MTNRREKDCLTADATLVTPTVTVMTSGHCEATVAYALYMALPLLSAQPSSDFALQPTYVPAPAQCLSSCRWWTQPM